MPTLDQFWKFEKKHQQEAITEGGVEDVKSNTLSRCLVYDPILKGYTEEVILPKSEEAEVDTVERINKTGFISAKLRTEGNKFDVLDIELFVEARNKSEIPVGFLDVEWRPSACKNYDWGKDNFEFPFDIIHVPVEKIDYFLVSKLPSFYLIRSHNLEEGVGCLVLGDTIAKSYKLGHVKNSRTYMGDRTFINVEKARCLSGSIDKLTRSIIKTLIRQNEWMRSEYGKFLNG